MYELTNAKGEELSDLIYQLSSGRQRNRMTGSANTESHRGEPWSLLAVSTGNTSVIERISAFKNAPKAEAARMLETKAVKLFDETKTKPLTDKHQSNSQNIYGHVGVPYLQYIMQNMDRVIAMLQEVQQKLDAGAQLTAQERHWSAGSTVTVVGFMLASELGFLEYDKEGFFRYALRLLKENKAAAQDMISSTADVLNDFVHEHWGSILKIKSTDDLRKGHDNGMDGLVIPEFDVPRCATCIAPLIILFFLLPILSVVAVFSLSKPT